VIPQPSTVFNLDPELAVDIRRETIEVNRRFNADGNRAEVWAIDAQKADAMAAKMAAGQWVSATTITIHRDDGHCVDGKHRLEGLIRSSVAIACRIIEFTYEESA
jgi:hypothetical protein